MKLIQLKINDEFTYFGLKHSVFSIKPPKILIQRIEGDRQVYEVEYLSLVSDPSFSPSDVIKQKIRKESNKVQRNNTAYLDMLPENKREIVSKKYEMIKPILMLEKVKEGDLLSSITFKEVYKDLLKKEESLSNITKELLYNRISKTQMQFCQY
ncbi:hypothetical protein [Bacillus suaedaesalsae]|uniref:CarD-like/TRCF RNAP-interacting domain-containing protein n=1 Tax=Bacillus suaedaesalsae TaxID=2810349 RepID=A0ABS2DCK6_9BACI|nr:hypothetical protein [Bacillus suaedaesalsae]MBM6616189.1 hypothetical protein [Bacillus suaedaesalsae]